jgi:hypothetical protein
VLLEGKKMRRSQYFILIAIFAALNVISDSFMSLPDFPSGVWYSWNFLFEALTGIILGPLAGFIANFIGVIIGHYIYFIDIYEFLFTIGAPIGAMVSAFLFRGKWKFVLIYYSALFIGYLSTPIVWKLPIWGTWDTYLAFVILLIVIVIIKKGLWKHEAKKLPFLLAFSTFIGLEADVLFRIFVFIPCQTYRLFYGFEIETLQIIWTVGAVATPLKIFFAIVFTILVGYPLIIAMEKTNFFKDLIDL